MKIVITRYCNSILSYTMRTVQNKVCNNVPERLNYILILLLILNLFAIFFIVFFFFFLSLLQIIIIHIYILRNTYRTDRVFINKCVYCFTVKFTNCI